MTQPRVHLSRSEPEAYKTLEAFSKAVGGIARANGIDERLKELILLHVSQLNGCSFCARVHVERAAKAGASIDDVAQLPVWRESGIFTERERAALELAEAFTFIHEDGIPDELYDRVGSILSEDEYTAVSWLSVSINAFNRVAIAGRYAVPPLATDEAPSAPAAPTP